MHTEVDEVVARWAARQLGCVTVAQARRAGASPQFISRRIRSGRWRRLDARVLALPSHPHTWEQRAVAVSLTASRGAITGRPAAAILGFEGFGASVGFEVTIPPSTSLRTPLARVRRSSFLRPVAVGPIRVNRPTLVVAQLAGMPAVSDRRLRHVVEDLVARDLGTWDELRDLAVRLTDRRVRGAPRLVALLEEQGDAHGVPMSALERLMDDTFGVPELPPLQWQRPFPWRPAAPQRLDALVEPARVILEGDGRAWHARLEQMAIDRQRDREALAHGYVVARYGYHEVRDDGPALLEELAAIVADRLPAADPRVDRRRSRA